MSLLVLFFSCSRVFEENKSELKASLQIQFGVNFERNNNHEKHSAGSDQFLLTSTDRQTWLLGVCIFHVRACWLLTTCLTSGRVTGDPELCAEPRVEPAGCHWLRAFRPYIPASFHAAVETNQSVNAACAFGSLCYSIAEVARWW